ncbi:MULTISPECIES: hypothetical protein [unclassified Mycobacterium]|uniref:hypothetical protein n=1 Tax=unclassified Mycobacterium TaxID=2642494 RepID=UPI000AD26215|nr:MULTISPECIES: hypothetical protein [unclassified Mycobacterium]
MLDEAAELVNDWKRDRRGGRFYERDCCFFGAEDGMIFLEVRVRDDLADSFFERVIRRPLDKAWRGFGSKRNR